MKIITITNQKGGVGKTTTALALASGLTHKGYRVLAVDLDPQENFTYSTGTSDNESNIYSFLKGDEKRPPLKKANQGFYVISGSINLADSDREFNDKGREYILKKALEPLKNEFDYCIIDAPPSLSILTVNALTASSGLIVPMNADIYSLKGLETLFALIQKVRKYSNPDLKLEGILLTKFNGRAIINKQIREQLKNIAEQRLGTKLFNSTIREAVAIKEVLFTQKDIFSELPNAKVTEDYKSFIEEFLNKEN